MFPVVLPEDEYNKEEKANNKHGNDVSGLPAISRTEPVIMLVRIYGHFDWGRTDVRAAVNMPTPRTVRIVPRVSKRCTAVRSRVLNGAGSKASTFGTIQMDATPRIAQIMARRMKLARQSKIRAAIPHTMLPTAKPRGLPAEKLANAQFFRCEGTLYAAPRMPMAGGTTMAEARPRTPHRMSIQNGFCAKATIKEHALKQPMPKRKTTLRPSKSASWPMVSWKAPAVRLRRELASRCQKWPDTGERVRLDLGIEDSHVAAAEIHEI